MKQLIEDLKEAEIDLMVCGIIKESKSRTAIRKAIEELSKKPAPEFIEAVKNERESFIASVSEQEWNEPMRTAAESLLIMYDQMAATLNAEQDAIHNTKE